MYDCVRIERDREGFKVRVADPEIAKANRERDKKSEGNAPVAEWRDPNVEFEFETKEQALAFVAKAIDIALPQDEYTTAFDKFAKEAKGQNT